MLLAHSGPLPGAQPMVICCSSRARFVNRGAGGSGSGSATAQTVLDVVEEGQVCIVQVGVDQDFHELLLEALDQVAHDSGQGTLVLAQTLAPKTGPQSNLHLRRVPEPVPKIQRL